MSQAPDSSVETWLPPQLAARALDVSERTLRRYVTQGRYVARRDGRRLQVLIPANAMVKPLATTADERPLDAALQTIQMLVDALMEERERTAALELRVGQIESEITKLQHRRESDG